MRPWLTCVLLFLAVALAAGCSSHAKPRVVPSPRGERSADSVRLGGSIASYALTFRGTPYRNGGAQPGGFDCSGLVQYVFGQRGLSMPRGVQEQYRVGAPVRKDDLQPGDLVFFATSGRGPSHVGVVVDQDEFVHAPSARGVVRVERLSSEYWKKRYVGARRVTE